MAAVCIINPKTGTEYRPYRQTRIAAWREMWRVRGCPTRPLVTPPLDIGVMSEAEFKDWVVNEHQNDYRIKYGQNRRIYEHIIQVDPGGELIFGCGYVGPDALASEV